MAAQSCTANNFHLSSIIITTVSIDPKGRRLAMEEGRRWEEMPTDCLVSIFLRLGLDDLTISVPFVCKSWAQASLDPGCWRVVDFRTLDLMPWSRFCKGFVSRYSLRSFSFSPLMEFVVDRARGSVTELVFPSSSSVSWRDLVYASVKCPGLKRLALPDRLMLEDELRIPELVGGWRNLEELELESKPSSFLALVARIGHDCRRFTRLRVSGLITPEDACVMVNCLPELKCLDLSKSYLTKTELGVIVNGCKSLERLAVKDCLGFEADEEVVSMASNLKVFDHQGSKLLDDYGYETDEPEHQTGIFCW
ncbi:unnamed protein product [Musa hybrid cultivar]